MEELQSGPEVKRNRGNATSTPIWGRRETPAISPEICSPIKRSPILSFRNGTFKCDSIDGCENSLEFVKDKIITAGLSPELNKLLVRPRAEEELDDARRLLTETINLTRAAMERGIITGDDCLPEEDVTMNSFYRPIGLMRIFNIQEQFGDLNLNDWSGEKDLKQEQDGEKVNNILIVGDEHEQNLTEYEWLRDVRRKGILSNLDNSSHVSWNELESWPLRDERDISNYVKEVLKKTEHFVTPDVNQTPKTKKYGG